MSKQSIETINANKIKEIHESFKQVHGIRHYRIPVTKESKERYHSHVYLNRFLFVNADTAVRRLLRGSDANKLMVHDLISNRKLEEEQTWNNMLSEQVAKNPHAYGLLKKRKIAKQFATIFSDADIADVVTVVAKNSAKTMLMIPAKYSLLSDENLEKGFVYGLTFESMDAFMALERGIHTFIASEPMDETMAETIKTAKEMLAAVREGILNQCKFLYEQATDQCLDFEACLAGLQQVHDVCYKN